MKRQSSNASDFTAKKSIQLSVSLEADNPLSPLIEEEKKAEEPERQP